MGISTWRAKRQMKYPERGVLRVTGFYDALSHSAPSGTRITGIITAPGIPDTPVEHKSDDQDSWAGVREVPVLVDRADPSRFLILWDEAQPISWRDPEIQPAQPETDRTARGQYGPRTSVTSTVMTIGPDGQPASGPMSPETAAQVQEALGNVFGQATGQDLGETDGRGFAQVDPRAFGQPTGWQQDEWQQDAPRQNAPQQDAWHQDAWHQATAMVLAARDVPGTVPGTVDLTLEVTRADGSTYTAATRLSFATQERRAAVAIYGTMLRVRIDPNVPARIEIDPSSLF